uniref:Zinc finger protein 407 n=1 Tax=Caenorhabditis tropicalis TaxID=1561998 RepID=A0A1I7TT79_9PELO
MRGHIQSEGHKNREVKKDRTEEASRDEEKTDSARKLLRGPNTDLNEPIPPKKISCEEIFQTFQKGKIDFFTFKDNRKEKVAHKDFEQCRGTAQEEEKVDTEGGRIQPEGHALRRSERLAKKERM